MRILHICQRDDLDTGGALRVAEALVHEQRVAGLDAWLLFLYGPPASIAEKFAPGVHCLELDSSRQALKGIVALRKAIKAIVPDIIHCHDGIMWPRLVLLQFQIPVIMHSHLPAEQPSNIKQQLGWALVKKTTDHLIGISLHTIDTWVRAGYPSSQIHLVPNGVDFERFTSVDGQTRASYRERLGLPLEKRLLLWVGRLHQSMKGSDRIERIAGLLPADMALVVVGNGPEFTGMAERCRSLIEAGQMFMVGSTSTPEDYYKAADAFLFTSYHEPFGLVILEAVSSGLPILAFPVTGGGGAVELLQEFNAIEINDAATPEKTERAIDALFDQVGEVVSLRKKAQAKYTWAQLSRQSEVVYESALKGSEESGSLKILHICQRDDLSTGGATRIAFDLVLGQRNSGVGAHLLFLYGGPGELGRLLPQEKTHYLGLSSAKEVFLKGWRILRVLREFNPDIVHHHDMLSWPQMFHALPHRYCMIYHAHLDYHPPSSVKERFAWYLTKRNAEGLITPSRYGKECLLDASIPERRISVIPNGTQNPDIKNAFEQRRRLRMQYGFNPERIVLGWGGRLHCATKGTDDFIRLFNHLPEKYVGIIAGHGPDEQMLRSLVEEYGLTDQVFFHGLEVDMPSFYQGLSGFVLTSHFESFGLVVIEALSNHVPVFSFQVEGGISDLLRLPGVSVTSDRSLSTMAALIQNGFAEKDELLRSVETGGCEVRKNYSIQRMASETLKLYARMELYGK